MLHPLAHRSGLRLAAPTLALAVVAIAGCQPAQERAATGAAPTSPSRAAVTSGTGAAATPPAPARYAAVPPAGGASFGDRVAFPPRNEPFQFRQMLEEKYRFGLGRGPTATFVDVEGDIVWTQEYLRYRVNGCDHNVAAARVFSQIRGGGIAPTCGEAPEGVVAFPPRNEPFAFRIELETFYRDALQRGPTSTYVDVEGDIVWTQEYLRYRVNGCEHVQATSNVLRQIDGGGIPPVCAGVLNGVWDGVMLDFPGGRTFRMELSMTGERVTGRITGDGTGGGGFIGGTYAGSGPVHLEADFGDGKQYFDGEFDGANRVRGTTTYNLRPPRYRFEMTR
jgi:hypothetical protein